MPIRPRRLAAWPTRSATCAPHIASAIDSLGGEAVASAPTLERPPRPEMGDYSTNAAMLLAPTTGSNPREVAERLTEPLRGLLGADASRVEVAGPGFLNLLLSDRWHREAVAAVLARDGSEAAVAAADAERVLVEFVSANPTGPLTVAGGRGAAFGDALARLLEARGHEVGREYLLNDVGGQVDRFAASIAARMRGEDVPEGGYAGEYVGELAAELAAEGLGPDDLERLAVLGTEAMRKRIAATLERFGVRFDPVLLGARPCTRPTPSRRRSPSCASAATSTRARAPSGCARPSSGTTRTGC